MRNKKDIKLMVLGHCRHGKDSMAEILRDESGMTFESSSQSAAECFEDRHNHRQEWYEAICEYNKDDKARLAKGIVERTGCYVGMRDREEIKECIKQGLFDLIVWVDASDRLPEEPATSFNIDKSCTDVIIENNGTYEEFYEKVLRFGNTIYGK